MPATDAAKWRMTITKAESKITLRSRSITRNQPNAKAPVERSLSRGRVSERNSVGRGGRVIEGTASAPSMRGRQARSRSPARNKVEKDVITKKSISKTPPSTPSVKPARSAGLGITPTRQSARHAEKIQKSIDSENKTDERLQKVVDELLGKGVVNDVAPTNAKSGSDENPCPTVAVVSASWSNSLVCALTPFFLSGLLFLVCTACNMKSYSLSSWPQVPKTLHAYLNPYSFAAVCAWFILQAVLASVPFRTKVSQDGKTQYRCNGLLALFISANLLSLAYFYQLPVFKAISEQFLSLAVSGCILALLLGVWLYLRAPASRKTGSFLRDLVTGCEMNPCVLGGMDIKSLLIVHCAGIGWALMDAVLVVEAYRIGKLDTTLVFVAVCHAFFIADFILFQSSLATSMLFMHETVGLRTCLLSLGLSPFLHSIHLRYIFLDRQSWSLPALIGFGVLFLIGYIIYRSSNYVKDAYRRNPHHPSFSGYDVIPSPNGRSLLCAGTLWGLCRHPNYLGHLIMSIAWSIPCGLSCPLSYAYPLWIFFALLHRSYQDNAYCRVKHGAAWDRYTEKVKSRLIPYIY